MPTITPIAVHHQVLVNPCDITSYARDIFPIFTSFLSPQEQAIAQRVSSAWKKALFSQESIFPRVQSILFSDENVVARLCENIHSFPKVTRKFHAILDPSSDTLSDYVSMVLQVLIIQKPHNIIDFLETISQEARDAVQYLDFLGIPILSEYFSAILTSFRNIEIINLVDCSTDGNALTMIRSNNKLKKVYLDGCVDIQNVALNIFLSKTKELEILNLSKTCVAGLAFQSFSPFHLKVLDLSECCHLDDSGLAPLLLQAKQIEELNLSETEITGEAFQSFDSSNLKILVLNACIHLEQRFLKCLLSQARQLEKLDLSYTRTIGESFEGFNPSNLKMLSLIQCNDFEDWALKLLLSRAKQLEELTLSYTGFTGEELEDFEALNLKRLDCFSCTNLEDEFLKRLLSKAKNLEALNLYNTPITAKAFQGIELPNLKEIIVREVGKLSLTFFKDVKSLVENFLINSA
ncbi:MAG: hypothetical protein COT84_05110 [Chlamydiae bacterium CG10_big_fil_rev_8_21_14_0_10_35_9]|nr:MAG: hypothetical protein COT84_05110 [Chlamydiae bacterium CG10_big_fil_rev_8_21_14_0_10_35_9]